MEEQDLSRLFIFKKPDDKPVQIVDWRKDKIAEDFPASARSHIVSMDCNFDGVEDFLLQDTVYGGNEFGLCFLYDPKSGRFFKSEIQGHNLEFDHKNRIFHEEIQKPGGVRIYVSYKTRANKMIRIAAHCDDSDGEIDCKTGEKIRGNADPFIPEGFSVLHEAIGDLNLDAYPDKILALQRENEFEIAEDDAGEDAPPPRPLLILIGQPDKTYKLAARNDKALLPRLGGMLAYENLAGITIKQGFFSIEQQGPVGGKSPTM
ncbi:MAG: hypothetical protein LBJ59_02335 [Zoogloeaceae bacterium]|nr:hypothetical protein [Zoogloeaceae bacterium]